MNVLLYYSPKLCSKIENWTKINEYKTKVDVIIWESATDLYIQQQKTCLNYCVSIAFHIHGALCLREPSLHSKSRPHSKIRIFLYIYIYISICACVYKVAKKVWVQIYHLKQCKMQPNTCFGHCIPFTSQACNPFLMAD